MKRRVLNAWPSTHILPDGEWISRLTFEATVLPANIWVGSPRKNSASEDFVQQIVLEGIGLTMAEDDILVADGLIRSVRIKSDKSNDNVFIDVLLEYPTEVRVSQTDDFPSKIELAFSRNPLKNLFRKYRIGIDPGHGGKDRGIKGPVNLLEKDVVLQIASELASLLETSEAVPILSRNEDMFVEESKRRKIFSNSKVDLCIRIHAAKDKNPEVQKYRILARAGCQKSWDLGTEIIQALSERMGVKIPGCEAYEIEWNWPCPLVQVEPLCLSHYVDEANFRAPLFRKRIAQSIYNGIARYLCKLDDKVR